MTKEDFTDNEKRVILKCVGYRRRDKRNIETWVTPDYFPSRYSKYMGTLPDVWSQFKRFIRATSKEWYGNDINPNS